MKQQADKPHAEIKLSNITNTPTFCGSMRRPTADNEQKTP